MERHVNNGTAKLTLVNSSKPLTAIDSTNNKIENAENIASQLPSVLQTTLELDQLILLFRKEVAKTLPFDSFHYKHDGVNCLIDDGLPHAHSCRFKLEMNDSYLGEISLTRTSRFDEDELGCLETLLCLLVYPLRNCLLYRQALASALQDDLTGLGNRAAFDKCLDREIELARRQKMPFSLIVLDIDNFKAINDVYGHISGDLALKVLADSLISAMRRSDIAFRYGGEEFTLVLNNTDIHAARLVAERIRAAVSELACDDGKYRFGFTVSLGIAQLGVNEEAYQLFDRADKALYRAKQSGKNTSICAPMMADALN